MVDGLILETTFLIDLEREAIRGKRGPAFSFLAAHPASRLYLTHTVAGELAAGPRIGDRTQWQELLGPFHILPMTLDVSWEYGRLYRYLATNGMLIGSNDLWIAATALAHDRPIVTANTNHFKRVPNLTVLEYC